MVWVPFPPKLQFPAGKSWMEQPECFDKQMLPFRIPIEAAIWTIFLFFKEEAYSGTTIAFGMHTSRRQAARF